MYQDTAPSFGSASVPGQQFPRGEAIAPFQIPAASGGNGAIAYAAAGLPAGLKFDATGTDADGCAAADFPPGTAASWATAPRTVCGTPTGTAGGTATFHARDSDTNRANSDRASLSVAVNIARAILLNANPSPLAEGGLNGATVDLQMYNAAFGSGAGAASFELVTAIPGLSIASVSGISGGFATLTLAYRGDFTGPQTLAVRIKAAAHNRGFDIVTEALAVAPSDTAPAFGTSTVAHQFFAAGRPITPFQLPAASGGDGAVAYSMPSLAAVPGLKFDATGADAGGCAADDFPAGTAASWATAPRTLCGTPAAADAAGARAVSLLAHDADSNRGPGDRAALGFDITVYGASITATSPSPLAEGGLNGATVDVRLVNAAFVAGVAAASFDLATDIPNVAVSQVAGAAVGGATTTLTLAFAGDFNAVETLAVTVRATAHNRASDVTTGAAAINPQGLADTAPSFASSAPDRYFPEGAAIAPFQLPAAVGGNGALGYAVAGLGRGLKFDATGTDAGGCAAGDFPPGTATSWATAPRTVCGTPTGMGNMFVFLNAHDADTNRSAGDRASLQFEIFVFGAAIASTSPAALAEANLHGAALRVRLHGSNFWFDGVTTADFELATDVPGASISAVSGGARFATEATLTLAFDGDILATSTLAVKVSSSATNSSRDVTTNAVAVAAAAEADTEPVFPAGPQARSYLTDVAIAPFQIPAATGGNGVLAYAAAGLPDGLKFDATGTDAGGCAAGDFPSGTAALWATAPRTICGTPTRAVESVVVVSATDADGDVGRLALRIAAAPPAAALGETVPATLAEASLHGATMVVTLSRTAFAGGVTTASFELVTAIADLSIASVSAVAEGDTQATLTLAFTGDFGRAPTIAVKVLAAAHREAGDLTTGAVPVVPNPGVWLSRDRLALNEAPGANNANVGTYAVALDTPPTGCFSVAVGASSDNPDVTVSPSNLSFNANVGSGQFWSTPRAFTVTAAQDVDGMHDAATISHRILSNCDGAGYPLSLSIGSVSVTVADDETSVAIAPTPAALAETNLDGATLALSLVNAAFSAGAPAAGVGAFELMSTSTIPNLSISQVSGVTAGGTTATLTLAFAGDFRGLPTLAVRVPAASLQGGVALVSNAVTVAAAAGVTVSRTSLALDENPGATNANRGTYTIVADGPPTGCAAGIGVAVSSDNADVAANPALLTFTTSTWNTAQTVTATAAPDNDGVDDAAVLSHGIATACDGADYVAALAIAGVDVAVDDAQTPAVVLDADPSTSGVDAGPLALVEGHATNAARMFSVQLATEPTQATTVTLGSADAGAVSIDGGPLAFDSSNWDTAQTVTARAADDDAAADESVALFATSTTATASEYAGPSARLTATVDDDETRAVLLSAATLSVPEADSATYTARLSAQPVGGNVAVAITGAGDGIATSPTSLTFTPSNWNTAQTVRASAANDSNGLNESVTLTHTAIGADYGGAATARIVVTATDDDAPSLRVAPTSLTLAEGASAVYTVRLNAQPAAQVTVTVGGTTAAVAVDTAAAPGAQTTMTFSNSTWSTPQTVTVSAPADDDATNATTTLTHAVAGTGGYANLGPSARPGVAVTVNDNDVRALVIDADPSTPNDVDAGPLAVTENQSAEYTVRLATLPTGTVTVTATSPDATLAVDSDASPLERTLTFTTSTWSTAQTVTARALDDLDGGAETTTIAHSANGGDYGSVSASLTAEVADDDPRGLTLASTSTLAGLDEDTSGTYTVALSTQPTGPVTVAIASSDASAATVDADDAVGGLQGTVTFTASTWNTARTVTVSALDDDDGFDETITLTHDPGGADYESGVSNATFAFTLDDDDPRGVVLSTSTLSVQEGGSATYTARLRTQPVGGNVTVTITGAGGGIAASPTSLTFTGANWNTPQQVRASAARDGDSMDETATLTHTPSGAGTDYAAGAAAAQIVVTATDIDTPGLQVSPTQLAVAEGASRAYTVRLNTDPLGAVTVTATSNDAAVTLDADSTPQERTLTFGSSNWDTPQTVTASAVEDDNATDESATVTHAASGVSAYTGLAGGALPSVQVAVDDNDTRALVIDADPSTNDIDAGPLAVDENSSKEYTVRLSTQPTGPVTVTATSPDAALAVDSDASPQTRTLTFTTSTWSTAQTVTARALDDDDGGNETVAIAHAALGGDYGGGVSATLSVAVADDDPRLVALAATSTLAGLDENDSATYTVALSTRPTGPVTVAISGSDASAATVDADDSAAGAQGTVTFTASTWDTARTVTVSALDDDDGFDETIALTHDPSGADYGLAPNATFAFTLDDDDPRGVVLSTSTLMVQENGSATYTVKLRTQPSGGAVTVAIASGGGGITVAPTSLTFNGANWNTPRQVRASAAEDGNSVHESVVVRHTPSGADYGGVPPADLTATAVDNDRPGLRVSPTRLAVAEGASRAYAVRLNTDPLGSVTVTATSNDAAVALDADSTPQARTLTFNSSSWDTPQTVTASAVEDDNATDETATVTHAASGVAAYTGLVGAALPSVQVAVDDNDARALVIDADPSTDDVDAGPLAVTENQSAQYTVRLATQPTGTVTVTATSPDPALAVDSDASPRTRTLTFTTNTWNTAQTVTARALDDLDGGDETTTIAHAALGGDYGSVSKSLTAETADDDQRRVLAGSPIALDEGGMASSTARLSTRPTGTVTVAITDDHPDVTVAPPTTLTFDAATWQTAQTFTIRAGEDLDGEDETATLTFDPRGADYDSAPSATSTANLADDDPRGVTLSESALAVPEGGSATYTVRLDTRPVGGDVTVTVGGTGSGISASPTALTFTGTNWNAPRAVRVSAAEDDNPTHESVDLTHSVAGADYGREGVTAGTVRATATDNDTPSLRVAPTALALVEEGADGFYAVRLNTPPSGDVTVTVGGATASVSVDADGGAPGAQTAMTFTTTDWATAQTVTVGAPADDDATNAATTLTHAVAGPGDYASLGPAARPGVRVTVEDDDAQALVIDADPTTPNDAEPGPLALNEQPGHADNAKEYTVRLATQPTGTVQVSIESGDRAVAVDGDSTPRMRTLTFSTTNWSAAQTVTATAAQDDDASAERVAISHEASGGGYGRFGGSDGDDGGRRHAGAAAGDLDPGGFGRRGGRHADLHGAAGNGAVRHGDGGGDRDGHGDGAGRGGHGRRPGGRAVVAALRRGELERAAHGDGAGPAGRRRRGRHGDAAAFGVGRGLRRRGCGGRDVRGGRRRRAGGAGERDGGDRERGFDGRVHGASGDAAGGRRGDGGGDEHERFGGDGPAGAGALRRRRLGRAEDVPGAWRAGRFGDDLAFGFGRGLRRRRGDDGGGDGARHAGGGGADRAADAGAAGRAERRLRGAAEHRSGRHGDGDGDERQRAGGDRPRRDAAGQGTDVHGGQLAHGADGDGDGAGGRRRGRRNRHGDARGNGLRGRGVRAVADGAGGGRRRAGAAVRAGRRAAAGGIGRHRHVRGAAAVRAVRAGGGGGVERGRGRGGGHGRRHAARPGHAGVRRDELVDGADGDGSGGAGRRRGERDGDAAARGVGGGQRLRGRDGGLRGAGLGRERGAGADRRVGFGGGADQPGGALDAVAGRGGARRAVAPRRPGVERCAAADAAGRREFGAHRRAGDGRGVRGAGAGPEPGRSGRSVVLGAGDAAGAGAGQPRAVGGRLVLGLDADPRRRPVARSERRLPGPGRRRALVRGAVAESFGGRGVGVGRRAGGPAGGRRRRGDGACVGDGPGRPVRVADAGDASGAPRAAVGGRRAGAGGRRGATGGAAVGGAFDVDADRLVAGARRRRGDGGRGRPGRDVGRGDDPGRRDADRDRRRDSGRRRDRAGAGVVRGVAVGAGRLLRAGGAGAGDGAGRSVRPHAGGARRAARLGFLRGADAGDAGGGRTTGVVRRRRGIAARRRLRRPVGAADAAAGRQRAADAPRQPVRGPVEAARTVAGGQPRRAVRAGGWAGAHGRGPLGAGAGDGSGAVRLGRALRAALGAVGGTGGCRAARDGGDRRGRDHRHAVHGGIHVHAAAARRASRATGRALRRAAVLPRHGDRAGRAADAVPTPAAGAAGPGRGTAPRRRRPAPAARIADPSGRRRPRRAALAGVFVGRVGGDRAGGRRPSGGGAGAGRRRRGGDRAGGNRGGDRPRRNAALRGAGGVPLALAPGQRLARQRTDRRGPGGFATGAVAGSGSLADEAPSVRLYQLEHAADRHGGRAARRRRPTNVREAAAGSNRSMSDSSPVCSYISMLPYVYSHTRPPYSMDAAAPTTTRPIVVFFRLLRNHLLWFTGLSYIAATSICFIYAHVYYGEFDIDFFNFATATDLVYIGAQKWVEFLLVLLESIAFAIPIILLCVVIGAAVFLIPLVALILDCIILPLRFFISAECQSKSVRAFLVRKLLAFLVRERRTGLVRKLLSFLVRERRTELARKLLSFLARERRTRAWLVFKLFKLFKLLMWPSRERRRFLERVLPIAACLVFLIFCLINAVRLGYRDARCIFEDRDVVQLRKMDEVLLDTCREILLRDLNEYVFLGPTKYVWGLAKSKWKDRRVRGRQPSGEQDSAKKTENVQKDRSKESSSSFETFVIPTANIAALQFFHCEDHDSDDVRDQKVEDTKKEGGNCECSKKGMKDRKYVRATLRQGAKIGGVADLPRCLVYVGATSAAQFFVDFGDEPRKSANQHSLSVTRLSMQGMARAEDEGSAST